MSNSSPERQSGTTLYDPPEGEQKMREGPEGEELRLEIPQDLATRLRDVALHLGLTPTLVASRAIEMVCDEVGLVEEEDLTSNTLIEKYQTRLDLLHSLDYEVGQEDEKDQTNESFTWDQVDEIIRTGEEARR
jgi:hypothetical protein